MQFRQLRRASGYPAMVVALYFATSLDAHDQISTQVTWDREISRLITSRCTSCHRDGGSAFSLTTYDAARPWAKAIKEETLERRMPPFGAVKGFADLRDDQSLTEEQLELISDWVEGGSPEGDPTLLAKDAPAAAPLSAPATHVGADVKGSTVLRQRILVSAAEAANVSEGGSLRAMAQRPDGSIVPLLWVYEYSPKFHRIYYFRTPFMLPAGTKILMSPGELLLRSAGGG